MFLPRKYCSGTEYYWVLVVPPGFGFARFDRGRPCEGAPAARSLKTEYSCGLVCRARNPRAPRQTFAGEILRMRGVGASGSVCFSAEEEQTAGCVVILATTCV